MFTACRLPHVGLRLRGDAATAASLTGGAALRFAVSCITGGVVGCLQILDEAQNCLLSRSHFVVTVVTSRRCTRPVSNNCVRNSPAEPRAMKRKRRNWLRLEFSNPSAMLLGTLTAARCIWSHSEASRRRGSLRQSAYTCSATSMARRQTSKSSNRLIVGIAPVRLSTCNLQSATYFSYFAISGSWISRSSRWIRSSVLCPSACAWKLVLIR